MPRDLKLQKVIFEDIKVRLACKKNGRNFAVFDFFYVCIFPNTFLYIILLISLKKFGVRCQKKSNFFLQKVEKSIDRKSQKKSAQPDKRC